MNHNRLWLTIALMLGLVALAQGQGWEWQNPLPQGNGLHDVEFLNALNGWAVGENRTVLHTYDGGQSWQQISGAWGGSLSFVNEQNGWIVGGYGSIFRTTDGGGSWQEQAFDTTKSLQAVSFIDSMTGWVGCHRGGPWYDGFIHKTSDGGFTWQEQLSVVDFYVTAIDFISVDSGWAVGYDNRSGEKHAILSTSDGGETWFEHSTGTRGHLDDVDFVDANHGWVVGHGGEVLYTANGGEGWMTQTTGGTNLNCVAFTDQLTGSVSGYDRSIFRTTNGGLNWSIAANTDQGVVALESFGNDVWAVGQNGLIAHSGNQGLSWELQSEIATDLSFEDVSFLDEERGWAVGWGSNAANPALWQQIVKTSNGGAEWVVQFADSEYQFTSIAFADSLHGVALSQLYFWTPYLLQTSDGGETWVQTDLEVAGGLNRVVFTDAWNGWIVGHAGIIINADALIMHTTDAGETWSTQVLNAIGANLYDISLIGHQGWAVGENGTILHILDDELNWNEQYPGTENDLYSVCFIDELVGMIGTVNQTILRTEDGGDHWTTVHEGAWPAITDIVFMDSQHGWAAGQAGTILETSDGGVNWDQYASGTYPNLRAIVLHDSSRGRIFGWDGTILQYGMTTGIPSREQVPPSQFHLSVYPNPFNSSTRLSYDLPVTGNVNLAVFDLTGRLVRTLEDRVVPQGQYTLIVDGSGLSSGMYFVRLQTADFSRSQKLLLLK